MKFLLTCLVAILPFLSFSQDSYYYTETVEVSGVSKDLLYGRAKQWINNFFNSSKAVIQSEDKEAGIILAKGIFVRSEWDEVRFSINIAVKDGKYKYELKDFWHEGHGGGDSGIPRIEKVGGNLADATPDCSMPKKHWQRLKTFGTESAQAAIASLKKSMTQKSLVEDF